MALGGAAKHIAMLVMALVLSACIGGNDHPNRAILEGRSAQEAAPEPQPQGASSSLIQIVSSTLAAPTEQITDQIKESAEVLPSSTVPQTAQQADVVPVQTPISDEQDFDAVTERETIESDAARLARNRTQYVVIPPTDLPARPDGSVNLVEYALQTNNPKGAPLYTRIGFNKEARALRNCSGYVASDAAQRVFLQSGGPVTDRQGLDPDGDGFACDWDPEPFRRAAQN